MATNGLPKQLAHLTWKDRTWRAKDGTAVPYREALLQSQQTYYEFGSLAIRVVAVKYPKTLKIQLRYEDANHTDTPGMDYGDDPLPDTHVIRVFTGTVDEFEARYIEIRQQVKDKIQELENWILTDDTRNSTDDPTDNWLYQYD